MQCEEDEKKTPERFKLAVNVKGLKIISEK